MLHFILRGRTVGRRSLAPIGVAGAQLARAQHLLVLSELQYIIEPSLEAAKKLALMTAAQSTTSSASGSTLPSTEAHVISKEAHVISKRAA